MMLEICRIRYVNLARRLLFVDFTMANKISGWKRETKSKSYILGLDLILQEDGINGHSLFSIDQSPFHSKRGNCIFESRS